MRPDIAERATVGAEPALVSGRRGHGRYFVRKALSGFARAIAQDVVADRAASAPGLLQRIDARAKLLGMAILLVASTLAAKPLSLVTITGLCVALAVASRIPLRSLLRVWLSVPLFSLVIILPSALNVVTPGEAVAHVWHFGPGAHLGPWPLPVDMTVTSEGLFIAARFVLRTLACVSLVLITTATTRPTVLLSSLRSLGVPKVFVMVVAMMYRYLTLLIRTAEDLHFAKMSRTIEPGSTRAEQRWVASGMGFIFHRCRQLGDEVYQAMVSRGYEGEARFLHHAGLRSGDIAYVGFCALVSAAVLAASGVWR
jgi:cobalt/nickel transport system permease protein